MSEERWSFREKAFAVLRSPGTGFAMIDEDDLRKGILIVLIIGLLSSWAGVVYLSKTEFDISRLTQSGPPRMGGGRFFGSDSDSQAVDPDALRSTVMPFIAIGGLVGAFTRWLVPGVLVLIVSKILIGDGSTKRMLTMTAFASLPLLGQQLLRVADAYTISSVDLSALRTPLFPSTILVYRVLNQGLRVFNVFGLLTLALTVYAVSANYEAPNRRALTVCLLAYLAYVLVMAFLPI